MRKKEFFKRSLLLGTLSLALCACGNDELVPDVNPDGVSRLSISVSAPASEGIVVRSLTRGGNGIKDETNEPAIKTLNVYLFKKEAQAQDENGYKFAKEYSFNVNGDNGATGKLTDGQAGAKTCSIDIPEDLMNQIVKVVLIANDKPTAPTLQANTTTLAEFRTSALATAALTENCEADKLVGCEQSKSTGFPMSAVSEQDIQLQASGASCKATLVRSVARIDIINFAPGLTIKGASLSNANNKSLLLANAEKTKLNVPASSLGKISLKPLSAYLNGGGISYANSKDTQGDEAKKAQNRKTAFYLYEESVTKDSESPVVKIDYEIANGSNPAKKGSVTVKFEKKNGSSASTWVNVKRNTLYTIILGDGQTVSTGNVTARFQVVDWATGEDITSTISPETESSSGN